MSTTPSPEDERQHLLLLLRKFHSAMLITIGDGGSFHARPMAIAKVEDDGRIWFLTASQSGKVHEIESDSHVSVTAQQGDSAFVAISGRATLHDDRDKVEELWREPFRTWFPDGKDDPSLELIAVEPDVAEYWDNTGSKRVSYLWEAAKAYVTGTRPDVHEGAHHGKMVL